MKILIACEYSGRVSEAFRARGHDVTSCDFLPSEDNSPHHYQGDIRDLLNEYWDMMVAHPPCTFLAVSGLHWNKRVPGRAEKTEEALDFVRLLMGADIGKIAIENPVSCISSRIRKPDQIIQPWQFGEDASKATCLWLKGLPPLVPTSLVEPRMVEGKPRWGNQTDSGQNKLGPSEDRWKEWSRTFQGIANALADQYSLFCATAQNAI